MELEFELSEKDPNAFGISNIACGREHFPRGPHHWLNLHLNGKLSSLHLCWKVHSDFHLCFSREEEKNQETRIILWSVTLAVKEENQAMMG
jgi:hypothetical protein